MVWKRLLWELVGWLHERLHERLRLSLYDRLLRRRSAGGPDGRLPATAHSGQEAGH